MSGKFTVEVASDPETKDLFAEVWHGDYHLARVDNDPARGTLTIELYPPPVEDCVVLDLEALQEVLEQAKQRMAQLGYPEIR